MMDDNPVDMDAPMTADEWAIWGAMWCIPEVRCHYQVHHDGPLTYQDDLVHPRLSPL